MAVDRFEALLVEEIPALRRYARALCDDPAQVDDLVQECLLRAVSRRRLWLSQKGMRPWLFTILHNIFVNMLRRDVNSPTSGLVEAVEDSLASDDDPHDLCTLSDFENALSRLSPEQREVLLLIGLEQMTYKEVSKIVGVPVGTVMSRLSRARSSLREGLAGAAPTARIRRVK